ncbi:MAG: biotin synthase BioB [Myxococcota bacterium]
MTQQTVTTPRPADIPDERGIPVAEARSLLEARGEALQKLIDRANRTREHYKGQEVRLCAITNAKSGRCPEDCGFCSQSVRYETDAPEYALKDADTIAKEAVAAWEAGAGEFSIVASGRAMTREKELVEVEKALNLIREKTSLMRCASLGLQSSESLLRLKAAGLQAVHHNLETARSHHANVVTTHTYEDEVQAVKNAKAAGLHVCSAGIFGMGEDRDQRIELLQALRDLDVDSIPLNFLNPRPGTPLAERHDLTAEDCLALIAVARLMLPTKEIFVCGGREVNLGERLDEIFLAGANGTMVGNYLTTKGRGVERDIDAIEKQGLRPVGITESSTAPSHVKALVEGNPQPKRPRPPLSERGRNALPVIG